MDFDPRCTDARALDFHWRASDDLASAAGLSELGRHSYRRARNSVLASLVLAGDSDRPWVSYSRSSDFYAAEGRYEGTDYSLTNLKLAVAEFTEAGLIEEMRSKRGSHLTHGYQSRMIATDKLMTLAEGVDLTYVGTRCPLVMKAEDGSRVAYRETAQTRRLVAEVEDINSYLGGIEVGISADASPDDWQHTRHHIRARKVKDNCETWTCVRPTPSPEVFRVFGRGRWDRHGRWYGWWQNLPKARRAELLINNELCIEPDFACLHPTLLYALRGVVLQHDPYELRGWDRSAGKLALNVSINAPTVNSAIQALLQKRGDKKGDGSPAWAYGPVETRRIVEAVKKANPVIANDIGSDAGVRLMSIDSGMAHAVMKRSRATGISVLPVHDSFIAPGSRGMEVSGIMSDVLAETISTISPSRSGGSVQSIRYTPSGAIPGAVGDLPSLEVAPAAEPLVTLPPGGRGNTPPSSETPSPEALGGLAAEVTATSPEGEESPLSGGTGSLPPEAAFRPVLPVRPSLRSPSLRPVVDPAPLSLP
ncbi:hypothetical protein FV227_09640, partial [Methylobacterium sp. WL119]|uniref:hypothetical protein n=3 Tax=Methylobacterium TaxID=407 RepID=UPI0011CB83F8